MNAYLKRTMRQRSVESDDVNMVDYPSVDIPDLVRECFKPEFFTSDFVSYGFSVGIGRRSYGYGSISYERFGRAVSDGNNSG